MILQIIGCSHHQSSVKVREQLAFNPQQTSRFLENFSEAYPESEAVLLCTCNRTELYAAGQTYESMPSIEEMSIFLANSCGVQHSEINTFLFEHQNEQAVRQPAPTPRDLEDLDS